MSALIDCRVTVRAMPPARPEHGLRLVRPQAGVERAPQLDLRTLIRLRLGNAEVQDAFIGQWEPLVEQEALRYARRGGPEEDLKAEGMLALWEAIVTYQPGKHRTAPEQYIANQVHRRVRTAYRKAMGFDRPRQVGLDLAERAGETEVGYSVTERKVDLQRAIAHLRPTEQQQLRQYLSLAASGLGPDEAAGALAQESGETPAAWKKRLQRVRSKLKAHL